MARWNGLIFMLGFCLANLQSSVGLDEPTVCGRNNIVGARNMQRLDQFTAAGLCGRMLAASPAASISRLYSRRGGLPLKEFS